MNTQRSTAGTSLSRARTAWGERLPDWVEVLAQQADRTSQGVAGKAMGYSGSVVNAVLGGTYKGSLEAIEKAVRGRFMAQVVDCPILGEIASHICLDHQRKAVNFSMGSSVRVRLARHCKGPCPHSRIGKEQI